jgi:hypothetical protein
LDKTVEPLGHVRNGAVLFEDTCSWITLDEAMAIIKEVYSADYVKSMVYGKI